MKFEDYKIGKRYFRKFRFGKGSRTTRSQVHIYEYLIVDKDPETKRLFASVIYLGKGTAPQWFDMRTWGRWKKEKPIL